MKPNQLLLTAVLIVLALWWYGQTTKSERASESPAPGSALEVVERDWAEAVERDWAEAVKRREVETIDRIQAAEFEFTDPSGGVWTKTRALEAIKAGDLQIDSFELSEVKVKLYEHVGVVTLRIVWHGRFRDMDISGPQRMTDVFVKRDGRWQCVASHASRIQSPGE